MELLLIITLAAIPSIAVGYFGVAFEHEAKKLKSNRSISKAVSTILLFPVLEKFVEFADLCDSIPERFPRIINRIKIGIYILFGIFSLILALVKSPYLILFIFGFIIWLIFKLKQR